VNDNAGDNIQMMKKMLSTDEENAKVLLMKILLMKKQC
jgi:hypothetical protein